MPQLNIKDIPVEFPFDPYPVQTAYMEKVIECLNAGGNAALESPTGTGKTLCLLGAVLAWRTQKKNKLGVNHESAQCNNEPNSLCKTLETEDASQQIPKVIYSSRTHSQLSQVIREFKGTKYSDMRMALMASRDQLCVNEELHGETNENKIELCQIQQQKIPPDCGYYNGFRNFDRRTVKLLAQSHDIEDLYKNGKKLVCCPYYANKGQIADAEIIFVPYNYLIDPCIQMFSKLPLENAIVIVDEAHNIEKMCEDASSTFIKTSQIAAAINDLDRIDEFFVKEEELAKNNMNAETSFQRKDLEDLKKMLEQMKTSIEEIHSDKVILPGKEIFQLLDKANIGSSNFVFITDKLGALIRYATQLWTMERKPKFKRAVGLPRVRSFLFVVFSGPGSDQEEHINKCYKMYVEDADERTLHLRCLSPAIRMKQLVRNVHSIILTSGTLSPMKPFISELGIPIDYTLENSHIINDFQVLVNVFRHGANNVLMDSTYYRRNEPAYISSLGETVIKLSANIPEGVLVFFSSYERMNKITGMWKETFTAGTTTTIWSRIGEIKPTFAESQNKIEFTATIANYVKEIEQPDSKGAILFAVCRGKVSEGFDFADRYGRAAIIIGIPLAPYRDRKVELKKQYLNENRNDENNLPTGDDWYFLDGVRAVNQAIGRVIRHRNDYGAILFCDDRYSNYKYKKILSKWIQKHIRNHPLDWTADGMKNFYNNAKSKLPKPVEISRIKEVISSCLELAESDTNQRNIIGQSPMVTIHQLDRKRSSDALDNQEAKRNSLVNFQRRLFPVAGPSSTYSSFEVDEQNNENNAENSNGNDDTMARE